MERRTLFCRRCNFSRWMSAANSQAGQTQVMILLMSALWRVSLMLVLNHSFLNREYILINVLKALASIISMCSLDVTFLWKITWRYFTLFTNGGTELNYAESCILSARTMHRRQLLYCCMRICWDSHVFATQPVHWRSGCCLATVAARTQREHRCYFYVCLNAFTESLPSNGVFWPRSLKFWENPLQYIQHNTLFTHNG
jgi:hypothetical protein